MEPDWANQLISGISWFVTGWGVAFLFYPLTRGGQMDGRK